MGLSAAAYLLGSGLGSVRQVGVRTVLHMVVNTFS